ncbi:MAG: hypothetical protein IKR00_02830 [Lachnospiraceae bacterium]|nr:hypothetical protein [Lachnospiraceae bacterium]
MKKAYIFLIILILSALAVLSSGCGQKKLNVSTTTLRLNKDGSITHVIIGDNPSGYTQEELSTYIDGLLSSYNTDPEKPAVKLNELTVSGDGSSIRIAMDYLSWYDYTYFNNVPFYVGTVKNALNSGYDFSAVFSADSGLKLSGYTLPAEYPDLNVMVVKEAMDILLPSDAIIVSDTVTSNENGGYTVAKTINENVPEVFQTVNSQYSYLIYKSTQK